ncbi:MAG: hypothetical protein AB7S70_17425, partial [Hyphomicrobium sp.]
CAADEVELNGKLFDAVGLNQKTSRAEPKMVARAPLVMPPDPQRVPEPGLPAEQAAANTDVASLQDPDRMAKESRQDLERRQAEYCKTNYELPKAHGDDTTADNAVGPLGPCKPSVLTAITNWTGGGDEGKGAEGQVEGAGDEQQ